MAARNLLAIHKLDEFKAWLDARGIEHRPTNADFQVMQVRLPHETQWHAIFRRLHAPMHLSVPNPLVPLVMEFVSPGSKPPPDESKCKPTGEYAAETPPWETE